MCLWFDLKLCTVSACCVSGKREFQSRIVAGRNDDAYCCFLTLSRVYFRRFLEDIGPGIDMCQIIRSKAVFHFIKEC